MTVDAPFRALPIVPCCMLLLRCPPSDGYKAAPEASVLFSESDTPRSLASNPFVAQVSGRQLEGGWTLIVKRVRCHIPTFYLHLLVPVFFFFLFVLDGSVYPCGNLA